MTLRFGEPVDLERLDETADDLAAWAYDDEDAQARARDERMARAALYANRSGTVTASPINPPIA